MSDRFYNAPDTEIDFTEQGGLMWGDQAVGKLVAGSDPLKPQVKAFVDDEAGTDVAEKVARRLQHFIDRKIAALFEPLLGMQRDEGLTGLARGFAFQLVEALGVLPRADVADDVKALDQDARGLLRKHGVRFGQFTIFLPLLLKPAPTRLRLVLLSLSKGIDTFPESPPPGLVSIPTDTGAEHWFHMAAGYRAAGERAIRIDMLERLADMIRGHDTRGGFEATPDMLSITGMTLEQFADLMQGLGYKADRGERPKAAKAKEVVADTAETPEAANDRAPDAGSDEGAAVSEPAAEIEAAAEPKAPSEPEVEIFYTFTWGGNTRRGQRPQGDRKPQGKGKGKPRGKPQGKGKPQNRGPKMYEARPQKKDRIDPDNPFAAALMGLKKD
ncbi:MAG: disulfide oxidoreductase, partial [Pseudomonadota bacterium]